MGDGWDLGTARVKDSDTGKDTTQKGSYMVDFHGKVAVLDGTKIGNLRLRRIHSWNGSPQRWQTSW